MSNNYNPSQSMPIAYKEFFASKINQIKNQSLFPYIELSKGKIITLLKTVFSFLNDNTLLKNDPTSTFEKYFINNKFIQTMSNTYYFYISNFPENGKSSLHDLIKERYSKFLKYYEQNENYFSNSKELEYRYYLIQGFILLWLLETKYDTEYYDDFIRVVNGLIRLDDNNKNVFKSKNNENNYLDNFLKNIVKFPFIKQYQQMILKILEANECNDYILNSFNNYLNDFLLKRNSLLKQDIFDNEHGLNKNLGKKKINSKDLDPDFPLIQEKSLISHKRKSLSNTGSQKGLFSSISSSGFYTPEFKHSKNVSIRNFRRFTMNNINNPKTSVNKNNYLRRHSMIDGMTSLLNKCGEANHSYYNNSFNINKNKNSKIPPKEPKSTKSKIRLAVQGHFYTEDDYKNNIEIEKETSKMSTNIDLMPNDINKIKEIKKINVDDDSFFENDTENEIENTIVSVDELPINPNISIISNSTSKNIGFEPENIIEETKEEEENDENDQAKKDNLNANKSNLNMEQNNSNNNSVKILTDKEINDFFNQQFSDNKNKSLKDIKTDTNINNKNGKINNIAHNNKKNKKRKASNPNVNNLRSGNTSRNNSVNNRKDMNNKDRKNSKKNINQNKYQINSNLFKEKNSKESKGISVQEKMKNYSNNNVFGILKNNKNKKDDKGLKAKNENIILQPCTKGKEIMNNVINKNKIGNENISKERLPTESVAKKNLLTLYNQLKGKK